MSRKISRNLDTMSTSFEELPDEVKLIIFSFFAKSELCKTISLVCKDWWILSKDPYLWKQVKVDFTIDTYDPQFNYDEAAKEDFEERVKKIVVGLKRCTMLEELSLLNVGVALEGEIPRHFLFRIGPIPTLKTLLFNGIDINGNTVTQIRENYPFIQKLSFINCPSEFNANDFATVCAALVHLKEIVLDNLLISFDFDDTCLEILSRCCTELENLVIVRPKFTDKGIMELAKNSNKTLQRVRLLCKMNETLNDGFVHFGTCQKLISLELEGFNVLSHICLKALSELPFLQTLSLCGFWFEDPKCTAEEKEEMKKGFEIFFRNPFRAKLKYVELRGLSVGESALIYLSQTCSSLQKLQLTSCAGITEFGVSEIFEKCCALDYVLFLCCKPLSANRKAKRVNDVLTVID